MCLASTAALYWLAATTTPRYVCFTARYPIVYISERVYRLCRVQMAPIMDTSVADSPRQFFSDCPDGMSMMTLPDANVPGVTGNTVFAIVQFEYTNQNRLGWALQSQDNVYSMYGKLPSPYGMLTLDQNPVTGELTLLKYAPVDTSAAYAIWIPCASSLSPWGTHLSSEEVSP